MRLLPQHRTALAILGFLFLGAAVLHWFLIRPLKTEYAENAEDITQRETRLQRTGLPLDSTLLEKEIRLLEAQLNGVSGQPGILETTRIVLDSATRMFMDRVSAQYGSAEQFRRNADRVSFQADYSRIYLKLAERDVHLAPSILGISDESPSPYIYQLLLRIWTAERLADLAHEAGLAVDTVEGTEVVHNGTKGKAADIRLLDVRGHTLDEDDKLPYLIELPVQASLRGNLPQVKAFLRKLTTDGNFLPASRVELFTDDPAIDGYHDGRNVRVDGLRLRVTCSAFFLLSPLGTLVPADGS